MIMTGKNKKHPNRATLAVAAQARSLLVAVDRRKKTFLY